MSRQVDRIISSRFDAHLDRITETVANEIAIRTAITVSTLEQRCNEISTETTKAIEDLTLIQKYSDENLKNYQVAVLCGGRGTRLKPRTDVIPKALIELNGKPILDYIVDFYAAKGLRRFILCIGYKGGLVKDQEGGATQQSPGDGQSLFLAP